MRDVPWNDMKVWVVETKPSPTIREMAYKTAMDYEYDLGDLCYWKNEAEKRLAQYTEAENE